MQTILTILTLGNLFWKYQGITMKTERAQSESKRRATTVFMLSWNNSAPPLSPVSVHLQRPRKTPYATVIRGRHTPANYIVFLIMQRLKVGLGFGNTLLVSSLFRICDNS